VSEWISLLVDLPELREWAMAEDCHHQALLQVRAEVTPQQLRALGFPDVAARIEVLKAAGVNGGRPEVRDSAQPSGAAGPRMFPILGPMWAPREVPWNLVEPHRRQALANHHQTLERLAERGGLDPTELAAVLEDRPWQTMTQVDAVARLGVLVGNSGS
jgi:hypothetical protein